MLSEEPLESTLISGCKYSSFPTSFNNILLTSYVYSEILSKQFNGCETADVHALPTRLFYMFMDTPDTTYTTGKNIRHFDLLEKASHQKQTTYIVTFMQLSSVVLWTKM